MEFIIYSSISDEKDFQYIFDGIKVKHYYNEYLKLNLYL
jgi:hypothetical protein